MGPGSLPPPPVRLPPPPPPPPLPPPPLPGGPPARPSRTLTVVTGTVLASILVIGLGAMAFLGAKGDDPYPEADAACMAAFEPSEHVSGLPPTPVALPEESLPGWTVESEAPTDATMAATRALDPWDPADLSAHGYEAGFDRRWSPPVDEHWAMGSSVRSTVWDFATTDQVSQVAQYDLSRWCSIQVVPRGTEADPHRSAQYGPVVARDVWRIDGLPNAIVTQMTRRDLAHGGFWTRSQITIQRCHRFVQVDVNAPEGQIDPSELASLASAFDFTATHRT